MKRLIISQDSGFFLCLPENAIVAFGNGSDVKTSGGQSGIPSPGSENQIPSLVTTAPRVSMEPEQNIRAQIPTQVRAGQCSEQGNEVGHFYSMFLWLIFAALLKLYSNVDMVNFWCIKIWFFWHSNPKVDPLVEHFIGS